MKSMSTLELMIKKNAIFEELTGVTLIPDDQLVDTVRMPLSSRSSVLACPYCQLYNHNIDCTECPMAKANNNCKFTENSTFDQVNRHLLCSIPDEPALIKLIAEYNKSNGFEQRKLQNITKLHI